MVNKYVLGAALAAALASHSLQAELPLVEQILDDNGGGHAGSSVAMWGEWAAIGDGGKTCEVDIYRFDYLTGEWGDGAGAPNVPFAVLNDGGACSAQPFASFGRSVAMHDGVIVIGAPLAKDPQGANLTNAGRAYVYYFDGTAWLEGPRLKSTFESENAQFGKSLAVWRDGIDVTIVVGSPEWDVDADDIRNGLIECFSWTLVAGAVPVNYCAQNGINPEDRFGTSLSIQGDMLAVGIPFADSLGFTDDGEVQLLDISTSPPHLIAKINHEFNAANGLPADPGEWGDYMLLGYRVSLYDDPLNGLTLMAGTTSDYSFTFQDACDENPTVCDVSFARFEAVHNITNVNLSDVSQDARFHTYADNGGIKVYERPISDVAVPVATITPPPGATTFGADHETNGDRILVNGEQNDVAYAYRLDCGGAKDTVQHMTWKMVSVPCGTPVGGFTVADVFGDLGLTVGDDDGNGGVVIPLTADYLVQRQDDADWSGNTGFYQTLSAAEEITPWRSYWLIWRDKDNLGTCNPVDCQKQWGPTKGGWPQGLSPDPFNLPNGAVAYFNNYPESLGGSLAVLPVGATERRVMLGNPFPTPMDASKILLDENALGYAPLGSGEGQILADGNVYVYDGTQGAGQRWSAVSASATPGSGNYTEPYQGFWMRLNDTFEVPYILIPRDK